MKKSNNNNNNNHNRQNQQDKEKKIVIIPFTDEWRCGTMVWFISKVIRDDVEVLDEFTVLTTAVGPERTNLVEFLTNCSINKIIIATYE